MSLAPSPSSSRGDIVLQPAYFTSSVFVHAARADIDRLVDEYAQQYARTAPFTLFKHIWHTQGWTWLHFKVFDARARAAFLDVMMRLFSERIAIGEPLHRAAALFGLYTMYLTQPSASVSPPLYSAARVPVTCDLYKAIMTLPDALDGEPVRAHVIYVQSSLLQAQVFYLLPCGGESPRTLPREIVSTVPREKKRGRPCRGGKAREMLGALEGWVGGPGLERGRYEGERALLVDAMREDGEVLSALRTASGAVIERIEMLQQEQLRK